MEEATDANACSLCGRANILLAIVPCSTSLSPPDLLTTLYTAASRCASNFGEPKLLEPGLARFPASAPALLRASRLCDAAAASDNQEFIALSAAAPPLPLPFA